MSREARIQEALDSFAGLTAIVVGDLMLDRYIWGRVSRISPEAPVPVVEVTNEAQRPGGAGNVVLNLTSLGAKCIPAGVVGDDEAGAVLTSMLVSNGASGAAIVSTADRPTTVKTRVIAGDQHVVRVDREATGMLPETVAKRLLELIRDAIGRADVLVIQDYNKGVLTRGVIRGVLSAARETGIPVLVDPKYNNFFEYKGVNVFKPNLREAAHALNRVLDTDEAVVETGEELLRRLEAEQVLLTRGSLGMSLFRRGVAPVHIPARAKKIHDVSGAGDTVIGTLALGIAAGLEPVFAAELANIAAGYVVGEIGVVPITREALLDAAKD